MQNPPKKYWLLLNQIEGFLAMYAVRQSPYHSPEGLLEALQQFRQKVRSKFDVNEMAQMDGVEVMDILKSEFMTIPEVIAWNQRKNGREGIGICSRYGKASPDDDFIDLDALIRNAKVDLFRELERDNDFDSFFDHQQKRCAPAGLLKRLWSRMFTSKSTPEEPVCPTFPSSSIR